MLTFLTVLGYLLSGFVLGSLTEYLTHRFVLHGLGRRKHSLFHYHYRHHAEVRQAGFQHHGSHLGQELLGLLCLLGLTVALYGWWAPRLMLSVLVYQLLWFGAHGYAHRDEAWCRRYLAHHHRHHMQAPHRDYRALGVHWDRLFATASKGV